MQVFLSVLPWILPVVLGAVIGYITNAIAIKMLFRPLSEKRFLGIRIPFTPGIIPKQRYQLSDNIGEMVSNELITEEALKSQISREETVGRFKIAVSSVTEKLLQSRITIKNREDSVSIFKLIRNLVSDLLYGFFSSKTFIYAVRDFTAKTTEYLLSRKVKTLALKIKWENFIRTGLEELLESREVHDFLVEKIYGYIKKAKNSSESFSKFISPKVAHSAAVFFESFLPGLTDSLMKWLKTDSMHRELEFRGRFLLRDILDKLNILQKFLITAGQFDKSLDDRMPEIIDDVLDHFENILHKEKTKKGIVNSLEKGLLKWAEKPLSYTLKMGDEKILLTLDNLYIKAVNTFKENNLSVSIEKNISKWLDSHREYTLKDFFVRTLHMDENRLNDFLSNTILEIVTKRSTIDNILNQIVGFTENYLLEEKSITVGSLLKISSDKKEKIDSFLADKAYLFISGNIPEIIEALNVKTLVVEKINALNVEEVEKLLLQVIAKHLKWINLFGAILGGIIGMTQIAIRLLGI